MELFTDKPGDEGLPGRERAAVMAALMMATVMVVFDGSVTNIALPKMAAALNVSSAVAVWFANAYLLSAAMTLAILRRWPAASDSGPYSFSDWRRSPWPRLRVRWRPMHTR
jgi:hypothetical protein